MTPEVMEQALERAEVAVHQGRSLDGTGFWKAVGRHGRTPSWQAGTQNESPPSTAELSRTGFACGSRPALELPFWPVSRAPG